MNGADILRAMRRHPVGKGYPLFHHLSAVTEMEYVASGVKQWCVSWDDSVVSVIGFSASKVRPEIANILRAFKQSEALKNDKSGRKPLGLRP